MDSHVTGANTPPRLAKLRRAIYALIGDKLLFSEEEQLQLSLSVHECQDAAELRRELARLQGEADRRLRVLALQDRAQAPVLATHRTQRYDVRRLARAHNTGGPTYSRLFNCLGSLGWYLQVATTTGRRLALVADAYVLVLQEQGRLSTVLN